MKRIILGIALYPVGWILNGGLGIVTLAKTTAALATVNGGGMEYQIARSVATASTYGTMVTISSIVLIGWGAISLLQKRAIKKEAATISQKQQHEA